MKNIYYTFVKKSAYLYLIKNLEASTLVPIIFFLIKNSNNYLIRHNIM